MHQCPMEYAVWIVSLLIIASKFADCYTTATQITHLQQERNPLARWLMKKVGIYTTIWGIFGLAVVNVAVAVWLLNQIAAQEPAYYLYYIVLGSFVAYAQFAVAHTNQTKKLNCITRLLLKIYR